MLTIAIIESLRRNKIRDKALFVTTISALNKAVRRYYEWHLSAKNFKPLNFTIKRLCFL